MKNLLFLPLTGLISVGAIATNAGANNSHDKQTQPAISQIMVTQYTGTDGAHPHAAPCYRLLLRQDGTAIYVGSKTYVNYLTHKGMRLAPEPKSETVG